MFHAVRARLYAAGLEPKTHAGVLALWSSHLVKSGPVRTRHRPRPGSAPANRELADYSRDYVVDEASAREDVQAATDLVERIRADLT